MTADAVTKYTRLEPALREELQKIVESLSAPGRGILAIDESSSSLDSKFREFDLENTETVRRDYRHMLLSADKVPRNRDVIIADESHTGNKKFTLIGIPPQSELSRCLSGVILNHETLYQRTPDGDRELMDLLRDANVIAGVKVDRGSVYLFSTEHEDTTEGLDGLQERCVQYKRDGCHFVKWRCTYKLSDNRPSKLAIRENANVLAKFATIAQSARMVPVVEPEILTTGEHEMLRALDVHEEVLSVLFRALHEYRVFLEGMILKPAMVVAGIQNATFCKPQIVADFTLTALRRTVPSAVPSIMFLSGGQSDEDATINLNAIVRAEGKKPWNLSFCYGRALQDKAMRAWRGNPENLAEAQSIFLQRLRQCSEASQGLLNVEEFERSARLVDEAANED